jgi:hypothetical protein
VGKRVQFQICAHTSNFIPQRSVSKLPQSLTVQTVEWHVQCFSRIITQGSKIWELILIILRKFEYFELKICKNRSELMQDL